MSLTSSCHAGCGARFRAGLSNAAFGQINSLVGGSQSRNRAVALGRAVTGIADEVGVFRRPPREGITPPPVRPKLRPIVDAEGAATGGIGVHRHRARRHARRKKGVVQQYVTRMVISFLLPKEDSCLCERF